MTATGWLHAGPSLIGTAIDTGCVASVEQPIGALPGQQEPGDPAKAAIEVHDLLSMTMRSRQVRM